MNDGNKTREELHLEVADHEIPRRQEQKAAAAHPNPAAVPQPATAGSQSGREYPPRHPARPDTPLKILLIEDNPGDARLIREMLAEAGAHNITLEWAPRLSRGLKYLSQDQIDLVLLDLSLPDSQGLDTFSQAYAQAPAIPFVLLTGLDDETLAITAMQNGAQDYLIKGETNGHKLLRAIRYATERKKLQEDLRRANDELEVRVRERTAELVAANHQLRDEINRRHQNEAEQQRLLADLQNSSEKLQLSNEELHAHGEELSIQNETLQGQAEALEDLTGELESSHNLLQAVLEQMPAGVMIAEPSGRIILTNRRAAKIWQPTSPDCLTDLKHFNRIPRFYPNGQPCPPDSIPLMRALNLGQSVVEEEYLLHQEAGNKLKTIHLSVNATPVRDAQGAIIAAVATYADITARKQARADLRQSEERYRSLVELSPDAIVVQAKGKVVFVNMAAVKLFGAAQRGDLLGQAIMDLMHPDYQEVVQTRITKVQSGGAIPPLEEKILRLNGEEVEVEAVGSPIMYQGRPALQVIFRDITARKQAEAALRAANEQLRAMIEASPLAIFLLTPQGIIQGANPAAEHVFGWRTDELLGEQLPMVPEDKWVEVRSLFQRACQGEQLTGMELKRRRKDGSAIDVNLSIAPMYDENGQVSGIVTLVDDITARKQAEAAFAQSRAEFEAIFNSISDAILFADVERRIVLANPAVKTLFGYDPQELIGKNVEILYAHQADYEAARERYFPTGRPKKPALMEITYRRKDGTLITAESLASQVRDAQGNILGGVGIHRDITARKVAEAALQESQRQTAMLADFLDNSSQPFVVELLDGRLGMFNAAYHRLLGYSHQELSRLNWQKDLTPPEWLELQTAQFAELQRTGQPVRFEKEYLRKDGSRVPVEMFMHMRRDEQGQPLLYYAFVTDITARKEAEAAVEQERQRLFALLDELPGFIFLHDENFAVRFANRRFKEIFGDPGNQSCYQVLHQRHTPCENCPVPTVIATQTAQIREKVFSDGRIFQVYRYPFRDMDGTPCILSLGLDITDRKEAEDALRKQAELLDLAHDAIIVRDLDSRAIFWNRGAEKTYGWTREAALAQDTHTLLQTLFPISKKATDQALMKKGQWEGILTHTRADGQVIVVASRQALQRNEAGAPAAVLEINRDITVRQQAEEALQESEARFRQLAENLDDAILLASADLERVHYISPAYERLWGRSCDSLYSQPRSWHESAVPADWDKVRAALKKLVDGDYQVSQFPEFRIKRTDGAVRWILSRFFPIKNEAGEVYRIAAIATDITARKEVEAILKWREEHLQQTAKMEALGQLAGGVAHDFNNLLTVISGYGELLLADLEEPDPERQQVQAILKAADQAAAVTRQLLAFSRKQVLQPQVLDLNDMTTVMVEMFSRLVDENIKISMHLEPKLGAVKADPNHMEQVLMNLVINAMDAMDAMPQGGKLTIETANIEVTPDDTHPLPEITPGAYVALTVADTGIGMDRETLSHIFEPFYTTKERGKGTGLGLSMAYGIIKQSGGHILVESTPQQGSSFRIFLPRTAKTRKPAQPVVVTPEAPHELGTILLVEDEDAVRHVVERMLSLKGYSVLTAHDGKGALKIGQNHPSHIHLLLTDVAMPTMGGRELAERLHLAHPEMKVLFMSGHSEDGMLRRGIRESTINFIQKPFRTDQLLKKVRELLGNAQP